MPLEVRTATSEDLDAIAALTRAHRRRLAGWSPTWWRAAENADALHPLWLAHLVDAEGPVVRVAVDHGEVPAAGVALPQGAQWFLDDLAVADGRWDAGRALVRAVTERPALTCAAAADAARLSALAEADAAPVSSYWVRRLTEADRRARRRAAAPSGRPLAGAAAEAGTGAVAPPHTFGGGGPLDVSAPGALVVHDDRGVLVGSPSTAAPPVYDPGGPVTVVDCVRGDRRALVGAALAAAADRGDAVLCVVVGAGDAELVEVLDGLGFARTVEVLGLAPGRLEG